MSNPEMVTSIPMPHVEELSLDCRGLGEFGEVCLQNIEQQDKKKRPTASIHKLAILPVESEIVPQAPPKETTATVAPNPGLSLEQANVLSFQAIASAFYQVEMDLSVIPEVADCICWLKHPLYNATTQNGRLFINANHPSLNLVKELIDFGHSIESVREPAYCQLTELVTEAIKLSAKDFQKYHALTDQVKQAQAAARTRKHQMIHWLYNYGDKMLPVSKPEFKAIEFNRTMLRYELAVHRLMRTIWPLVLKNVEQQEGRESAQWCSAFLVYGRILRSTQVISSPILKYQLVDSLPSMIEELFNVFTQINLQEVIREEILCRLMRVHLAIIRGCDGTEIREHKMDTAFAFRCLKGNLFADKEYQRLFNAEGRISNQYFEKLLKRVYSREHKLTELEEHIIAGYRSVVSTEPTKPKDKTHRIMPDVGLKIKGVLDSLVVSPVMSTS